MIWVSWAIVHVPTGETETIDIERWACILKSDRAIIFRSLDDYITFA